MWAIAWNVGRVGTVVSSRGRSVVRRKTPALVATARCVSRTSAAGIPGGDAFSGRITRLASGVASRLNPIAVSGGAKRGLPRVPVPDAGGARRGAAARAAEGGGVGGGGSSGTGGSGGGGGG